MIQIQKHLLDNFGTTAYKDKVKQERSSLTKFTWKLIKLVWHQPIMYIVKQLFYSSGLSVCT